MLRTSGIAADTITVTAMQGESPIFDLNLANGTVAIPIRGMRFPRYTYRNAVRESLKWATCDPLPSGSKKIEVLQYHALHPFDVEGRWVLGKDSNTFTTNSIPQSTKVGGISGASIDYSTSYCGSLSQHINLNAIPDGRVIMPPLNVNVRGNTHPFLNFAYKLTPNSRATLLLRFRRNWKVYTCAVQLTHATPANGVTAHPTCIDLRSQIITDGEWHDISFNWRSLLTSEKHGDINSLFPNMQTSVLLMNVAIGAQVYLSSCPSNQDRADTHGSSGVLAGEILLMLFIDKNSVHL